MLSSTVYSAWQHPATTRPTTFHVCKTRGCWCSFRLLMMGSMSPETCWALHKYGITNFDTLLHLVGFFCMNCTMMHGSTNIKKHHVRVCVLFYAESTFVCVGHASSTQQEHLWSMKLILKWILCYSYRAFPYIPYFNEQNPLIKIQYDRSQNTLHIRCQLLCVSAPRCHLQRVY